MTAVTAGRRQAPSTRTRMGRLRAEAPDLAVLAEEKRLTLNEAEGAFRVRQARKVRELQAPPRGPQPGDVWLSYDLPIPRTAADHKVYANFVLNHSPAVADKVKIGRIKDGGWPLIVAVKWVMDQTGCTPPCDEHTHAARLESLLLFLGASPATEEEE